MSFLKRSSPPRYVTLIHEKQSLIVDLDSVQSVVHSSVRMTVEFVMDNGSTIKVDYTEPNEARKVFDRVKQALIDYGTWRDE